MPAAAPETMTAQKTFVLDTNVLLHSAASLESFEENHVVLPMGVLEELDQFKEQSSELGRNARHVIRRIDALRGDGHLNDGVPLAEGGTLRVLVDDHGIDNPYLDAASNGLTYAVERLKELDLHGHVTLRTSERSRLAAVAAERL